MQPSPQLDALRDADRQPVSAWFQVFLEDHIRYWGPMLGVGQSDAAIRRHVDDHDLVALGWADLLEAGQSRERLVQVARDADGAPLGIVQALTSQDGYLRVPVGTLQWIYVDDVARGRGVGRLLMNAALDWMSSRGCVGSEVYVSANNQAAVSLYEELGYQVSDLRLLRPERS